MILTKIKEKGKLFRDILEQKDVYTTLLIVFVGIASFGLGRIAASDTQRVPIILHEVFPSTTQAQSSPVSGAVAGESTVAVPDTSIGTYVGSRNGSKYHFPWCSGAQRMKEENKIWFSSVEEAIAAGYSPAANCKGL